MKALVVYYSNTGNNRYLAEKIAQTLNSDIEAIKPRFSLFPVLILFSLLKTSPGIKTLSHKVKDYDSIVLCGPIWMGQVISPLRDFFNRYGRDTKRLYFASSCGGGDAAKDGKFGYAHVFHLVKTMLGDKCIHCEAFPIGMVLPDDKKDNGDAVMKTRLSDDNFSGEIQKRFNTFIHRIAG
jgi:hypothetical protein